MRTHALAVRLASSMFGFILILLTPANVLAHCDGLDGPVVTAARAALESRNPALVLIWVQPKDEAEIRAAFDQTIAVRELGPEAKALADRYFFETLVRVHRAGEGAPYTGLQPAGRDLGPAIPAGDKAVADGTVEPVVQLLSSAMQDRLRAHFNEVVETKGFAPTDVVAGRDYVKAYVEFIHYVERLYDAATTESHGHFGEDASAEPHR